MKQNYYRSPFGMLKITAVEGKISTVSFVSQPKETASGDSPVLNRCLIQLKQYFAGELKKFSLPLDLAGTEFQRQVWQQLLTVSYGETISYGELARELGKNKRAAQAVGRAVGKNRIAVILPCHRVVGSDGSLTGYRWGIKRKQKLLKHEQVTE